MNFDPEEHRCIVLASDGLWNLLDSKSAVTTVEMTDRKWFREALYEKVGILLMAVCPCLLDCGLYQSELDFRVIG